MYNVKSSTWLTGPAVLAVRAQTDADEVVLGDVAAGGAAGGVGADAPAAAGGAGRAVGVGRDACDCSSDERECALDYHDGRRTRRRVICPSCEGTLPNTGSVVTVAGSAGGVPARSVGGGGLLADSDVAGSAPVAGAGRTPMSVVLGRLASRFDPSVVLPAPPGGCAAVWVTPAGVEPDVPLDWAFLSCDAADAVRALARHEALARAALFPLFGEEWDAWRYALRPGWLATRWGNGRLYARGEDGDLDWEVSVASGHAGQRACAAVGRLRAGGFLGLLSMAAYMQACELPCWLDVVAALPAVAAACVRGGVLAHDVSGRCLGGCGAGEAAAARWNALMHALHGNTGLTNAQLELCALLAKGYSGESQEHQLLLEAVVYATGAWRQAAAAYDCDQRQNVWLAIALVNAETCMVEALTAYDEWVAQNHNRRMHSLNGNLALPGFGIPLGGGPHVPLRPRPAAGAPAGLRGAQGGGQVLGPGGGGAAGGGGGGGAPEMWVGGDEGTEYARVGYYPAGGGPLGGVIHAAGEAVRGAVQAVEGEVEAVERGVEGVAGALDAAAGQILGGGAAAAPPPPPPPPPPLVAGGAGGGVGVAPVPPAAYAAVPAGPALAQPAGGGGAVAVAGGLPVAGQAPHAYGGAPGIAPVVAVVGGVPAAPGVVNPGVSPAIGALAPRYDPREPSRYMPPPGYAGAVEPEVWPVPGPRSIRAIHRDVTTSDLGLARLVGRADADATSVVNSDRALPGMSTGSATVRFSSTLDPFVLGPNMSRWQPVMATSAALGTQGLGACGVTIAGGGMRAAASADVVITRTPDIDALLSSLQAAGSLTQTTSMLRTPGAAAVVATTPIAYATGATATYGAVPHSSARGLLKMLVNMASVTALPELPTGMQHLPGWRLTDWVGGVRTNACLGPSWWASTARDAANNPALVDSFEFTVMTSTPFLATLAGNTPPALAAWFLGAGSAFAPARWGATDTYDGVGIAFVTKSEWACWSRETAGPATLRAFATGLPAVPATRIARGTYATTPVPADDATIYYAPQVSRTLCDVNRRVLVVLTDASNDEYAVERPLFGVSATPGTMTVLPTVYATTVFRTCWYNNNDPAGEVAVPLGASVISDSTVLHAWHAQEWEQCVSLVASMETLATVSLLFTECAYAARIAPAAAQVGAMQTIPAGTPWPGTTLPGAETTGWGTMAPTRAAWQQTGAGPPVAAALVIGFNGVLTPAWTPCGVPCARSVGLDTGADGVYWSPLRNADYRGAWGWTEANWMTVPSYGYAMVAGQDRPYQSVEVASHLLPGVNFYTWWLLYARLAVKADVLTAGTRTTGLWGSNIYALAAQSAYAAVVAEVQHSYEMLVYQATEYTLRPPSQTLLGPGVDQVRLYGVQDLTYTARPNVAAREALVASVDATALETWRAAVAARVTTSFVEASAFASNLTANPWNGAYAHRAPGLGTAWGDASYPTFDLDSGTYSLVGASALYLADIAAASAGVLAYRPPLCAWTYEAMEAVLRRGLLPAPRAVLNSGTFAVAVSQLSPKDTLSSVSARAEGVSVIPIGPGGTQVRLTLPLSPSVSFGTPDRSTPVWGAGWRAALACSGRAVGTAAVFYAMGSLWGWQVLGARPLPVSEPAQEARYAAALVLLSSAGEIRLWTRPAIGLISRVAGRLREMCDLVGAIMPGAFTAVDAGATGVVLADTAPIQLGAYARDMRVRLLMAPDATPLTSVLTFLPPTYMAAAAATPPLAVVPATDPGGAVVVPF